MSDDLALVLYLVISSASSAVVFLMVTRRGWWRPTGDELDWTTTAGCPRCNEHGPYPWWDAKVIVSEERARDMHQGWHEVSAAILGPVVRLLDRMQRVG